jgi:hypothetical protein
LKVIAGLRYVSWDAEWAKRRKSATWERWRNTSASFVSRGMTKKAAGKSMEADHHSRQAQKEWYSISKTAAMPEMSDTGSDRAYHWSFEDWVQDNTELSAWGTRNSNQCLTGSKCMEFKVNDRKTQSKRQTLLSVYFSRCFFTKNASKWPPKL